MGPSPLGALLLATSLGWLSAFLMDEDHMTSPAPSVPHFTACVSRDQATFRCWWSEGSFHNLSQPGALRVFYRYKQNSPWKECPEYVHSKKECFFDANHTAIWTSYCIQLRSYDNVTYFNKEDCFTVENIVRPDPPVALNWTLLSVSQYGPHYDVIVSWEPPTSADVRMGWMRLAYEVQYRKTNGSEWTTLEVQGGTQQTFYGLRVEEEYEVHVRCKMKAFTKFGHYSDSIFIQLTEIPIRETMFPVSLVLGILAVVVLIMLIIFSQQQRITVLLLPPVPTPKIKDIDPEMLSKGRFEELNFILSGGGVGSLPSCGPLFYQDEPLVDCIEVDPQDPQEPGEDRDGQASDAQRLLGAAQPPGQRNALSFVDEEEVMEEEDSVVGVADRLEPPPSAQDALRMLLAAPAPTSASTLLLPGQPQPKAGSPGGDGAPRPQAWLNTDFYAQVSDVMPSGGVVLSPGQQLRALETTAAKEEEEEESERKTGVPKGGVGAPWGGKESQRFQLLVVPADPCGDGYTANAVSWQTGAAPEAPADGYHTLPAEQAGTAAKEAATAEDYHTSYVVPDSAPAAPCLLPPVSDYTVVQEVDCQRSLLLNPPPPLPGHHCLPPRPQKALAPMPVGYVTPDLLGSITP